MRVSANRVGRDAPPRHPRLGYAVAILGPAVVTAVKIAVVPVVGRSAPVVWFVIPVLAAAWLGGAGPGLAAIGIGALAAGYFFVIPHHGFALTPSALELILSFVLEGAVVAWGMVALRNARARADARAGALARSESTMHAIIEAAAEGIAIVDAAGRIVRVNHRAEDMFGYDRDELLGQPLETLLPERFAQAHARHRAAFFAEPRSRPMGSGLSLSGRRRDGSEFPIEVSLSCFTSTEGPYAMALMMDISQRLARERAARQSEKLAALGTLVAGIAHEINNPIGIISTRIETMLLEAGDTGFPPDTLEDLRVLHRNTHRVAGITQRLLTYARHTPAERVPVDLNAIVEDVVALMRKQVSRDGVRIVVELAPATPRILASAGALQQVIVNLMLNAAQAISDHGRLTVRTAVTGDPPEGVQVVVEDTGCGIAADKLNRIFDPFYTSKASGTGLGLSVSLGIVQEFGGTITVKSELGRGSTFTVCFPVRGSAQSVPER